MGSQGLKLPKDSIEGSLLENLKREFAKERGLERLPTNLEFLEMLGLDGAAVGLRIKPIRSASGIVVLPVMTKPFPCPHGTCLYCPGGPTFDTPQSYPSTSPATVIGKAHNYDPKGQIWSQLAKLRKAGHAVEKAEVIILGGTFLAMPIDYQRWFVKGCYDALNGQESSSLEEAMTKNELSSIRSVGLTIETKPDYCKERHVDLMLSYGCTKVEIGVQCLDDGIYKLVNRGHTLQDVVEAFQCSRDAGLKIVAHMMPGLPTSSPEKDLEDFRSLFSDPRFKPDMLKIYPTVVVPGTGLHGLYKLGRYKPYELEELIELLINVKRLIPSWVRIMRIQRELSPDEIAAGVKKGNLRQMVLNAMRARGLRCRCIRCREVGIKGNREGVEGSAGSVQERITLRREEYEASDGLEFFLSYEAKEALVAFLRLRVPSSKAHRWEIRESEGRCCIVRELRVYGRALPFSIRSRDAWQHKGYGRALMEEAERLAKEEFDAKELLVLSAVGTREYYRRLGYRLKGAYMAKRLT